MIPPPSIFPQNLFDLTDLFWNFAVYLFTGCLQIPTLVLISLILNSDYSMVILFFTAFTP